MAVVHDSNYELYKLGELASAGVEQVAEVGSTSFLSAELDAQISDNPPTVKCYNQGNALFNFGLGITTMEVRHSPSSLQSAATLAVI